jgi:hypothetical protein
MHGFLLNCVLLDIYEEQLSNEYSINFFSFFKIVMSLRSVVDLLLIEIFLFYIIIFEYK